MRDTYQNPLITRYASKEMAQISLMMKNLKLGEDYG